MGHPTDEEFFARLLEHARPRLQALLRLYGVESGNGEDLMQEALLALWRKRAQVENYENWLFSALRVECLRYRRREGRQIHSPVDEAALERLADQGAFVGTNLSLNEDLRELVRRLPARHRALIQFRYGLGLTPEETADRLGYRLSSLKKTTTRCLQMLRRQLGRDPSL